MFSEKNVQNSFPTMRGRGVKGRLKFFRKFIRFGNMTRPKARWSTSSWIFSPKPGVSTMDGWWDRRQGKGGDRDEGHQATSGSSKSSLPVFRHLPTFKHALLWLFLIAHPSPQTIIVDTPAIVGPFDDASSLLALCLEVLPHQSFRNYNCCIFPSMTQAWSV